MRIAGIDYGRTRVGIAVAEMSIGIAHPLANYTRRGAEADTSYFRKLVEDEFIDRFVVGLPVHLDGRESPMSAEARAYGLWLEEVTGREVEFFDERFTSAEAEQLLEAADMTSKQRKARRDQLAAQIMLTAYLEAGGQGQDQPDGIE
jgi:putative Holliday junction resolvase